jgi:hypothetical protein
MSPGGVAGERNAASSAASWSARRSSSAGSVGAAATKTVAWGALWTADPVAGGRVVVDTALPVVLDDDGWDFAVVVVLSTAAEVVVDSTIVAVVGEVSAAVG